MNLLGVPKIQVSVERNGENNYIAAVLGAGGAPVAGCCPAPDLSCDGLMLCGGGDLDSALFGQPSQGSNPPDKERDRAELALFNAFFRAGKPVLGICRGMQVINVALGGTLIQDLPQPLRAVHAWNQGDKVHPAASRADSLLYKLYGPAFSVNSAHHQALDRLGRGLRTVAWAEDGLPEAVDLPGAPLLGVQFHPERMPFAKAGTVDGSGIFAWFLNVCQN